MKSTKAIVFVIAGLLVLLGLCLLPSAAGQGRDRSLEQRVAMLESQVAELLERIEQIEGGSCSCTVLNLQPLADFPAEPSEGDMSVVWTQYLPEEFGNILYCYLEGVWVPIAGGRDPVIRQ
jgi:hypothetical protein